MAGVHRARLIHRLETQEFETCVDGSGVICGVLSLALLGQSILGNLLLVLTPWWRGSRRYIAGGQV